MRSLPEDEARFGPIRRRARAIGRATRYALRTAAGAPRRVAVELRWRLGDEIMALPIFDALRAQRPADHLIALFNYPELLENHPFVDAVNPPSPAADRYFVLRGADRRVERIADYARAARTPLPVTRPQLYFRDWRAPQLGRIPEDARVIALAPGATWPTKRWRPERWSALARALHDEGFTVIILGLSGESFPAEGAIDLTGQTSVREAACLLRRAEAVICCDSGLMHLGLAAGTRAVALFGPTRPEMLVANDGFLFPIRSSAACAGHWHAPGPDPEPGQCPEGHDSCLDSIEPGAVLGVLRQALEIPRCLPG